MSTRGSTILVVDDDPEIRDVLCEALTQQGYDTCTADNGAQALEILSTRRAPIELVITDLMMPVMDGGEFTRRVHDRWPHTAILLMTGYGNDVTVRTALHDTRAAFLPKPFKLGDLATCVASLLEPR
jgi:DNA-binding NtrC family response regulator